MVDRLSELASVARRTWDRVNFRGVVSESLPPLAGGLGLGAGLAGALLDSSYVIEFFTGCQLPRFGEGGFARNCDLLVQQLGGMSVLAGNTISHIGGGAVIGFRLGELARNRLLRS